MEYAGNILYDRKILEGPDNLIIFGAGSYGRKILEYLRQNGREKNIVGFCDSDKEKAGSRMEGISVYQLAEACQRYPDAAYLIAGKYITEMYRLLQDNGIRKVHFLFL